MAGKERGYQRYQCKNKKCRKWFRIDGKAEHRKYDAHLIGETIGNYIGGLSIQHLAESIGNRPGLDEPSKATIYHWISDYTDKAKVALRGVKAKTNGPLVGRRSICAGQGAFRAYLFIVFDKHIVVTYYLLTCR